MPNIVLLSGNPQIPQEKIASQADIIPGMLVEVVPSGGDAGQLRKHATAGGNAQKAFANVALLPNKTAATDPIDTPYADGDTMQWLLCRSGDVVYSLLPASAVAVVDGDPLESNGDGTLRKETAQAINEGGSATYTVYSTNIVGYAAEAVDNSGGATTARIRVRVA